MKKDEILSKKCFSRQKADGPTHHKARTRLINLANLGDRASRGSVPGKKVLRMYSGTPSKPLGLPVLAAFCMSIVAEPDQNVLASSELALKFQTGFRAANSRLQTEETARGQGD
jgi:hypothetical protein